MHLDSYLEKPYRDADEEAAFAEWASENDYDGDLHDYYEDIEAENAQRRADYQWDLEREEGPNYD